jgi:hypothetical protein
MNLKNGLRQLFVSLAVILAGGISSAIAAPPTIAIASPRPGVTVTNSTLSVTGTAHDAGTNVVSSIVVSVNGVEVDVTGSNSWSASASLTAGTNIITAYAVNSLSQFSATNRVIVYYKVTGKLSATITGRGSFSPNYNGALLNINRSYTMTALAGAGFKFANWTVIGTTNTSSVTKPRLTFEMVSGLQLIANMIDIERPAVTIATVSSRSSNSVFTIAGRASDNLGLADVYYQVEGGSWNVASSTNAFTNWSAVVILGAGRSTINVYAEDAAGNRSLTKSVVLVNESSGFAPLSLNGTALQGLVSGQQFLASFGPATYADVGTPVTSFAVGTYIYTLIDANTAELSMSPTVGGTSNFTVLNFTNNTGGTYSNTSGTGPFALMGLASSVPASLNGVTLHGEDTSDYGFTNVLGDGTSDLTEPSGTSSGTYAYTLYSPSSALLVGTYSNAVDYALLNFGATSNTYETLSTMVGSSFATDSGIFTVTGEAVTKGYKAPLSIDDLVGAVTIVKTNGTRQSSVIAFDPGSYAQISSGTNNDSKAGTYSFVRTGTNTATFILDSVDNSDTNELFFTGPHTASFTNTSSRGTVTLSAAPKTVASFLTGKKVVISSPGHAAATISLAYGGTFTGKSSTNVVSGTYSYAPYAPEGGLLQLNFTDTANAGVVSDYELWFSSAAAGRFEETDNFNAVTLGTFTVE